MNTIDWLAIAPWVAVIISFLSLALSFYNFFREVYKSRANINVEIDFSAKPSIFYLMRNGENVDVFISLVFENKSWSGISITRISLVDKEENSFSALMGECFVYHYFSKSIDTGNWHEKYVYTNPFPINLLAQQGALGIVKFSLPKKDCYEFSNVIIKTNRKVVNDPVLANKMEEAFCLLSKRACDSHENCNNQRND